MRRLRHIQMENVAGLGFAHPEIAKNRYNVPEVYCF